MVDGNGHSAGYTWDQFGNMTSETDARGITTTYAYADPDNNLTSMSYSGSSTSTATLILGLFAA